MLWKLQKTFLDVIVSIYRFLQPAVAFLLAAVESFVICCGILPAQTITVDPAVSYQEFYGWGTSGCWWAQEVGDTPIADWVAEMLYDDETGLGLDIYRYNIGGGEKENPNARIFDERATQSFWVYNEATSAYAYDFTRDEAARNMLDLAIAYGATEIVLFCNSPHFSLTTSGSATGGFEKAVNNLPQENYQKFVDYVLDVADHFVSLGYPVTYISPINEPMWSWGGDWVGQEGCHYELEDAIELLELFALNMQQRGVTYGLSAPESGNMGGQYFNWQERFFASEILNDFCDVYSGHSYNLDHERLRKRIVGNRFQKNFPDKRYEMGEWCELPCTSDADSIDSALYMANIIVEDLTLLQATGWSNWVAVNRVEPDSEEGMLLSDGLMRTVDGDFSTLALNKRYYAYRHFTNHIGIGATRIDVADSFGLISQIEAVAFRDGDTTTLVLINNKDQDRTVQLAVPGETLQVITTDAIRNYVVTYTGAVTDSITLPAESISTLVLR